MRFVKRVLFSDELFSFLVQNFILDRYGFVSHFPCICGHRFFLGRQPPPFCIILKSDLNGICLAFRFSALEPELHLYCRSQLQLLNSQAYEWSHTRPVVIVLHIYCRVPFLPSEPLLLSLPFDAPPESTDFMGSVQGPF